MRAFVTSLANGELQGYITTPGANGYEANWTMFKPESGDILVEKALELIAEAKGQVSVRMKAMLQDAMPESEVSCG